MELRLNRFSWEQMSAYFPIDRKLIVSSTAYQVYRLAAWLSLVLLIGLITAWLNPWSSGWFDLVARPFLLVGSVASALTLVAMEIFLFRYDKSGALKQIFWFAVLMVPLLGAALYCLFVYSRSAVVKACITSPSVEILLEQKSGPLRPPV